MIARKRRHVWQLTGLLALGLMSLGLLSGPPALAERIIEAGPGDYREQLRDLGPGDVLRLAPGVYTRGLSLRGVRGEPGRPVVIEGPADGPPAIFMARNRQITISLVDSAHVTIRHLHLDGNGASTHAIVAERRGSHTHDITLEHLDISGYNAAQGYVGISTKAPAWNWVIRNNHIRAVGTGLYLGDSDGSAPFIAGLVEGNVIEHTIGYNMQIKHQQPRPQLPGMPTGPSETVIRDNVFSKVIGSGQDGMARPNLLVGHWPIEGPGRDDRYLIHDNLFFHNPTERLFQGEGNVVLYHNHFVNLTGEAVTLQPHNDVPREVVVAFNTIVSRGVGLRLIGAAEGHTQRVIGNALFAEAPMRVDAGIDDGNRHRNLAQAETDLVAPLAGLDAVDLRPRGDALRADHEWGDLPPGLPDLPGLSASCYGADAC